MSDIWKEFDVETEEDNIFLPLPTTDEVRAFEGYSLEEEEYDHEI